MENNEPNNQIIIYQGEGGQPSVQVRIENETVWLPQAKIVELFASSKANVSEHIKHIFEEGELQRDSVVRKFRTTAADGKNYDVEHYNLDMIISLGYRINSEVATHFRQWATARLKEYIVKGFTMDDERLKAMGGGGYWKELLARIRDIRVLALRWSFSKKCRIKCIMLFIATLPPKSFIIVLTPKKNSWDSQHFKAHGHI